MTTGVVPEQFDAALTTDVIAHLDAQLVSARKLLGIVLEQSAAIRRRDVQQVVALTGALQAELQRRALIERDRARLLDRAAAHLGVSPTAVSMSLLDAVMDPARAPLAHARSAELRGILEEVQREHHVNRALMNQELAFLDHLLRLTDADRHLGYDAAGDHHRVHPARLSSRHRTLDLEV
jgi:flagellar biosynthesis/type III secretory pathway chaperone